VRTSSHSSRLSRRSAAVSGGDQPLPGGAIPGGQQLPELRHDRGVDVQPAGVGQPAGGEHLEPVRGAPDHRGVERAGPQIVDGRVPADRDLAAGGVHEVAGRGHRFGGQLDPAERGGGGGHEGLPAGLAPVGRAGQHGPAGWRAGHPRGLLSHPPQHRADQVLDRELGLPEQHRAVVDPALRVRLEPLRLGAGGVAGVPAGQQPAGRVGEDRRGQQRRPVEQQRAAPTVRPGQHRHRVRGAKVHPEPEPVHRHRTTVVTSHRALKGTPEPPSRSAGRINGHTGQPRIFQVAVVPTG